jgi:RNA 2',3'-cyclic 3'-phosphodiesterase
VLRLFAGIEIDDAVRTLAAGAIEKLQMSALPARFERPEKMHVTLAFLGRTPTEKLRAVEEALANAAAAEERFSLMFDRVGAFPNERRPRVLWLGCSSVDERFAACARSVRSAFATLGYEFDAEAVAHVTLCRARPPLRGTPQLQIEHGARLDVGHLTLFESIPDGRTTRYEIHARAPLRPA